MSNKSFPYTDREKILLAQLVREYKVVENKKTDATTVEQKNKAWELISKSLLCNNSQPEISSPRSSSQLKKLWNNLKQKKRKQTTEERYSFLLTGGGPPKKPKPDPVLDSVEDAAPNMDVTLSCPWDSTGLFEEDDTEARVEEPIPQVQVEEYLLITREDSASSPDASLFLCPPSVSASFDTVTSKNKKTLKKTKLKLPVTVSTERDARVTKIKQAMEQQRELHSLRLKICEEEREQAQKKAEWESRIFELEIKKRELEVKKAEDEAKLASYKLQEFLNG